MVASDSAGRPDTEIFALANPGVRALEPYPPGKPIDELKRELGLDDIIKLASNENSLGPSPLGLAAAREALSDLARYPDGSGFSLKRALAARHGLSPPQITLGNGSNDLLELVVRAFVLPEHEVVFSQHAFAVYPIVTSAVGARAVVTPARDWGHDLTAMQAAITPQTRVVFVANPNNPTGTWTDAKTLQAFVSQLPRHVICVVDEAYFEYVEEGDYPDATRWLPRFPNLVVTRTFSKIFGLAGLRVGYGVSSTAIADLLNRVRQPFNVNSVALAAAEAALDDTEHVARSRRNNREGMEQLTLGFAELGLRFIPSVGNFVCVDLGRPAKPVFDAMLRQGVIVRPVANYEMPNHLRITIGTSVQNARALSALRQALVAR